MLRCYVHTSFRFVKYLLQFIKSISHNQRWVFFSSNPWKKPKVSDTEMEYWPLTLLPEENQEQQAACPFLVSLTICVDTEG